MDFLKNWTIDLNKVPKYAQLRRDLVVAIDKRLGELLVEDERIPKESRAEFEKTLALVKNNTLQVHLEPRRGLGRRYPQIDRKEKDKKYYGSLIGFPKKIKNTNFKLLNWVDIDQKKGHPTILLSIAEKNKMKLPAYETYLNGFDDIWQEISAHHSEDPLNPLTKGDIKHLFNRTIYGGGINNWFLDVENGVKTRLNGVVEYTNGKVLKNKDHLHPFYQQFLQETQMVISLIFTSNPEMVARLCSDLPDDEDGLFKKRSRVMSYFCGVIENHITWMAFDLLVQHGVIKH
jgi:hypothetical protein